MSNHLPSLLVTVVGSDRKRSRILSQVEEKLRRRGLQPCVLKNWRDTAIGDCDILLIGCGETEVDQVARQIEHLWTRKWNHWYAETQERRSASEF